MFNNIIHRKLRHKCTAIIAVQHFAFRSSMRPEVAGNKSGKRLAPGADRACPPICPGMTPADEAIVWGWCVPTGRHLHRASLSRTFPEGIAQKEPAIGDGCQSREEVVAYHAAGAGRAASTNPVVTVVLASAPTRIACLGIPGLEKGPRVVSPQ